MIKNPNYRKLIANKVFDKSKRIIEMNLQGLRQENSFDIGKIDYRIDDINERINIITSAIIELIINEMQY